MVKDSFEYIQQLEGNWSQVSKALYNKENATLEEVLRVIDQVTTRTFALPARSGETLTAQRIYELEKELAALKRERDSAVAGLKKVAALGKVCIGCIHVDCDIGEMCQQNDFDCWNCRPGCVCKGCVNNSLWQWRGVCPENTEVRDENNATKG